MISAILNRITAVLNDTIKLTFNLKRDIAKIQPVDSNQTEGAITVSLIHIERDTSAGISFHRKTISPSYSSKGTPSWHINFYVLIAVVFPKKQYGESIKLMTEILRVIQTNHVLSLDQSGVQFTMEPMNVSFQELSNLWSISGGTYHPSVVCKIKSVEIDGDAVLQVDTTIKEREINL